MFPSENYNGVTSAIKKTCQFAYNKENYDVEKILNVTFVGIIGNYKKAKDPHAEENVRSLFQGWEMLNGGPYALIKFIKREYIHLMLADPQVIISPLKRDPEIKKDEGYLCDECYAEPSPKEVIAAYSVEVKEEMDFVTLCSKHTFLNQN